MLELRAILVGLVYAFVAVIIMRLGYHGLKLNVGNRSKNVITIGEIHKSHKEWDGEVVSLILDSCEYSTNDETGLHLYRILPSDINNNVWLFYAAKTKLNPRDTVFGVMQSITSQYPELLIKSGDFSNIYVIEHTPKPKKWYWNIMLIGVPLLFLRAFVQAMYRMLKGKSYYAE